MPKSGVSTGGAQGHFDHAYAYEDAIDEMSHSDDGSVDDDDCGYEPARDRLEGGFAQWQAPQRARDDRRAHNLRNQAPGGQPRQPKPPQPSAQPAAQSTTEQQQMQQLIGLLLQALQPQQAAGQPVQQQSTPQQQMQQLIGLMQQALGAQKPAVQQVVQPAQQQPTEQQLEQAFKYMHEALQAVQMQAAMMQLQRSYSQLGALNSWMGVNPYSCAATFPQAYAAPFAPYHSPYGTSYAEPCAYSPFSSCGSVMRSMLPAAVGFGLGALLC
ncbi:hypothetical protein [Mitsuaria sp. 7]|uniref:hypothetical protein n=1 Tax=Mitsuaria sp. 7 TaxID=1658665 RepID=UPI0018D279B9|nr:hypothetical protein [Mitsuaria sp. 7]